MNGPGQARNLHQTQRFRGTPSKLLLHHLQQRYDDAGIGDSQRLVRHFVRAAGECEKLAIVSLK